MQLVRLPPDRYEETVGVLCHAFPDYPVMRYVSGAAGARYDDCLRSRAV